MRPHLDRTRFNRLGTALSIVAALISLALGAVYRSDRECLPKSLGPVLVGVWVLLPPVWFWFEWVFYSSEQKELERSRVQHLHDLSRTIWLALVVVLAALFEVRWNK